MTMINKTARAVLSLFAFLAVAGALAIAPAGAQVGKLVDANMASEAELAQLPNMTADIAKQMVAARPFKTVVDLNKFLLDHKLTPAQAKAFYGKAFVPINLNTGTKDEFLLIPGVGPRMSGEFEEYRPWKTWTQFDKEIGKYVGQQETDRLKQYFYLPTS
jgi:DNA uptake protein ComE-like DNA-binding protein